MQKKHPQSREERRKLKEVYEYKRKTTVKPTKPKEQEDVGELEDPPF